MDGDHRRGDMGYVDKGGRMKTTARIMEFIGIASFFMGGAGMDEPTLIPLMMVFGGIAIAFLGWKVEGLWTTISAD